MIKEGLSKLNINRQNNHLKDIYSSSYYLELGTINYDVIIRLLNYELINIEDISYYPIQNHGLGKSTINNPELRKISPFLFYQNLFTTNGSLQLFITYGLLRFKDENEREVFSPIVLIPVNIYFEDEKIYVQQISRPIENTILLTYLADVKKINVAIFEKLDSIYNIDRFCLSFTKFSGYYLELENFLTFVGIKEHEIIINFDKFNTPKVYDSYLYDKYYDKEYPPTYYYKKLNQQQRYAVNSAYIGNSLVIAGRMATGKTTALINIAINAIHQEKKVLYVSNMKETLDRVYQAFEEKELGHYVSNFSNSFVSLMHGELITSPKGTIDNRNNLDTLYKNYHYINEYETAINSRILDNRYLEIENELAILSDEEKKILPIDDLTNLYKHEYLEVVNAIITIQGLLSKIGSVKNTIWKEIPIINNIRYPNQIFTLLNQIQKCFMDLQSEKTVLESDYGIRDIPNYAYLKNLIHNIKSLNIVDIPESWHQEDNYEEAKEEFKNLKNVIYHIEELEYNLNFKYHHIDELNIKDLISQLLDPYFRRNDIDKVNRILEDRINLVVTMDKTLVQIDVFKKAVSKISQLMNWDFNIKNYVINVLLGLNKILQETKFSNRLLKAILNNNFENTILKMKSLYEEYHLLKLEESAYLDNPEIPIIGTIEKTIELFLKYENNESLKYNYFKIINNINKNQHDVYLIMFDNLKKLKLCLKNKSDIEHQFYLLTGFEPDKTIIDSFQKLYDFYNSLTDKFIQTKVSKFLDRITDEKNFNTKTSKVYLSIFDLFNRSFMLINEYYRIINDYSFGELKEEFIDRINELLKISNYLKNVFLSNDQLYSATKNPAYKYIKVDEYFDIENTLNEIKSEKESLKNNSKYHDYYGYLFENYQTNIHKIARLLQAYKIYSESFEDNKSKVLSFEKDKYVQMINHLNSCQTVSDQLNELFKIYFKIFKESVSRYYYSDFESNLKYLEKLLDSKEELITYLGITENIHVLNKYHLDKFIEFIIQLDEYKDLVIDFKYTYLTCIKDSFIQKYPYLVSTDSFENSLNMTIELENEIIKDIEEDTIADIRKHHGNRFSVFGIKNLDYNGFIRRTNGIKSLFLTTTQILNNYIDINHFDLVIIDDAHLLSINHYYKAVLGEQVVIAGELQLQSAVANNLISRMSSSKNILLNYRFDPSPKSLLDLMTGLNGRYYSNYYENFGVDIIDDKILEHITLLIKQDSSTIINLFVSSISKQRMIYEELSNILLSEGFSVEEIVKTFRYNLNIANLEYGHLYHADYNILFLEDYYEIDIEYIVVNLIDSVLECKKRLIIYDNNNYLKVKNPSKFLKEVMRIINNRAVFMKSEKTGIIGQIALKLELEKLTVYAADTLSMLVRKKTKLYGILLLWDNMSPNYDTLNRYREFAYYRDLGYRVILIWSINLTKSINEISKQILEEIDKYD